MKERPARTRTVEPVIALGDYLDALFRPVQEVAVGEPPQAGCQETPVEELVRSLQEEPAAVAETPAAPVRPASRLQLLLLDLGGLRLAVPLEALSSIHRLPQRLTRVPHQQAWLLGVYDHHGVKVAAVDTFGLVVPPSHRERLRRTGTEGPPVVVTAGGGTLGAGMPRYRDRAGAGARRSQVALRSLRSSLAGRYGQVGTLCPAGRGGLRAVAGAGGARLDR